MEVEEEREEWEGEKDGILIAATMLTQHSRDLVLQTQTVSFLLSLSLVLDPPLLKRRINVSEWNWERR